MRPHIPRTLPSRAHAPISQRLELHLTYVTLLVEALLRLESHNYYLTPLPATLRDSLTLSLPDLVTS